MATLAEIEAQLKAPFDLADIDFLPKGQFEKDGKTFITGFPFADPRVYQDRLNQVCPGEWSTPQASVTIAGNKIITLVTVIICGVPHTDIGEASLDGPTKENAGTESWSQAFKRACSQAGLGRFLYSLDKAFLPYDKQRKRIDLDANALRAKVRELYVKAGIIQRTTNEPAPAARPAQPTNERKPAQEAPSDDLRPAGAAEQALERLAKECANIAGEDKGPAMYLRIYNYAREKFHVGSDTPDANTPDDVLTEMWTQVRKAKKQALAKAS